MYKPSNHILELAKNTKEKIEASDNLDAHVGKLTRELYKKVDVYIEDVIDELKALGLTFEKSDNDRPSDYTRFDVGVKGEKGFEHATLLFQHEVGNNVSAILNVGLGRYVTEITDRYAGAFFGGSQPNNIDASKTMERVSEIAKMFSKAYTIIENEFNSYSKDIKSIIKDGTDKIEELKRAGSNPIVAREKLMEAVAIEVYGHLNKSKSADFKPMRQNDLIKKIKRNKNFFFAMNGQGDTLGEQFRLNMFGDGDKTYRWVLADIINTEAVVAKDYKELLLPFVVDKGGYNGFPIDKLKIVGKGKNFKTVVSPSQDDKVLSYGIGLMSPRKPISQESNDTVSDVFIMKGWLLAMVSLWSSELDSYMELFK